jgi:hypothetical protein
MGGGNFYSAAGRSLVLICRSSVISRVLVRLADRAIRAVGLPVLGHGQAGLLRAVTRFHARPITWNRPSGGRFLAQERAVSAPVAQRRRARLRVELLGFCRATSILLRRWCAFEGLGSAAWAGYVRTQPFISFARVRDDMHATVVAGAACALHAPPRG